ncbi:hypothetical protein C8Q80DRAFT_1140914 [Daedaleopsis nitida]|nr:hypothetical protein C8Q80DRAFT_1140914 [Daedaleopsis nitida]
MECTSPLGEVVVSDDRLAPSPHLPFQAMSRFLACSRASTLILPCTWTITCTPSYGRCGLQAHMCTFSCG